MGWTDDLENCGVREPLPQVPYLGVPSNNGRSSSRSRSRPRSRSRSRSRTRSQTLRHPNATPNISNSRLGSPGRLKPPRSAVHFQTTKATVETRRGRNTLRQTQTYHSTPVITFTDTMASHSTYQHGIRAYDAPEEGTRPNTPEITVVSPCSFLSVTPPGSQAFSASHLHPPHRRHYREGHVSHLSPHWNRQLEPANEPTYDQYYTHSRRASSYLDPNQLCSETSGEHGRWAGRSHSHIDGPARVERREMRCESLQSRILPPQPEAFVGGFAMTYALQNNFRA